MEEGKSVSVWLPATVADRLADMAAGRDTTRSKLGAALLERALTAEADKPAKPKPNTPRAKAQQIALDVASGRDELLDVEESARRTNTTATHIRELIRTGRLTHVRVGRFMRVPASAIAAFIFDSIEVGR